MPSTLPIHSSLMQIPSIYETTAAGQKYRVAVVGGGPSGACAAEALARNPNIECVLFERKMDNAKPCGGAIPVCMVEEFNLPSSIIDRKVICASSHSH